MFQLLNHLSFSFDYKLKDQKRAYDQPKALVGPWNIPYYRQDNITAVGEEVGKLSFWEEKGVKV